MSLAWKMAHVYAHLVRKHTLWKPPLCRNRWWFSLGILVSFTGVLGATSALRYQGYNKPSTELVKPAGGVQLLGVLTGEIVGFCRDRVAESHGGRCRLQLACGVGLPEHDSHGDGLLRCRSLQLLRKWRTNHCGMLRALQPHRGLRQVASHVSYLCLRLNDPRNDAADDSHAIIAILDTVIVAACHGHMSQPGCAASDNLDMCTVPVPQPCSAGRLVCRRGCNIRRVRVLCIRPAPAPQSDVLLPAVGCGGAGGRQRDVAGIAAAGDVHTAGIRQNGVI